MTARVATASVRGRVSNPDSDLARRPGRHGASDSVGSGSLAPGPSSESGSPARLRPGPGGRRLIQVAAAPAGAGVLEAARAASEARDLDQVSRSGSSQLEPRLEVWCGASVTVSRSAATRPGPGASGTGHPCRRPARCQCRRRGTASGGIMMMTSGQPLRLRPGPAVSLV